MGNLSATTLRGPLAKGRYHDGDGLFLSVTGKGARSWICRVQKNGRRRDIGIGSAKKITLSQARQRAAEIRALVEAGIDPVLHRKRAEGVPTFREAAVKVFNENSKSWKNKKHRGQWLTSLEAYAFPKIGDVSVSDIDSAHVRDVLIAIWLDKNETARRVRQRIGMVIDWAIAKDYRAHPLPMTAINKSLPKIRKRKSHHRALPYAQVQGFMKKLRERESIGRLAFEFLILTAARSGEVRGALWSEVDFEERTWTIPAARMKADQEHVVPLSDEALAVLKKAKVHKQKDNDLVFPGTRHAKPMSDMTLTKICRDAGVDAVPRAVLNERTKPRDTVASPMPQVHGAEHELDLGIAPVSPVRETDHPFTGIAEIAFTDALNVYLEAAPKSLSEKDQFRYVNLEAWKIVQRDPCLQTGQIAARVREGAEKRGRHIDYTDDVLGKIVGRSASGTYGTFKAFLIKQGLVR